MASSLIGQLRILLGLETASFESSAAKTRSTLATLEAAAKGVQAALSIVGVGLVATEIFEAARGALEYAAALDTTSQRIGVTVEQLQVMRKAARDNGIETDAMEQGLARLNLRLGQAKAGLPAAVKAFKDIGISKEQLDSFHSAGDALPAVEEGLHKVGDGSTQAAAAQELLSRAALKALPVFTMGKEAYDAMYDSAVKSGLITAEQAEKAHTAEVAVENLAIAFKTKLAEALADNVDGISSVIDEMTMLINLIPSMIGRVEDAGTRIAKIGIALDDIQAKAGLVTGQLSWGEYQAVHAQLQAQFNHQDHKLDVNEALRNGQDPAAEGGYDSPEAWQLMRRQVGAAYPAPPKQPAADTLDLAPHHHKHDDTAQKLRDAENATYQAAKEELDGKKQILEAQLALTTSTDARSVVQGQMLELDHDQQALEIKHRLTDAEIDPKLTAGKKAELEAQEQKALSLNDQLLVMRQLGLSMQTELQREQENSAVDQAIADAKTSKLQLEEGIADTTAQRRAIELELLQITNDQKRRALQAVIDSKFTYIDPFSGLPASTYLHSDTDRAVARRNLDSLNANEPLQRQQIARSTAGPLEQLYQSIPDTAGKMNEALQKVAADGLSQLDDGLAQASASWIKMGGVAGNILRQIYTDLMKLLILKYIEKPILNALGFGGGDGTTTSFIPETISDASLPHMAGGGSFTIGGMAGIDANTLSLNGSPIAMVNQGERLDVVPANDAGPSGGAVVFDLRGAVMTEDLLRQMNDLAAGAAVRGAAGGAALGRIQLVQAASRRMGR